MTISAIENCEQFSRAGSATEIYPDNLKIKEHDRNASTILFKNNQNLVNRFEKECRCKRIYFD